MADVLTRSSSGQQPALGGVPPAALAPFLDGLLGEHLGPDHPGYDVARRVWNGMADKRPGLIVRCAGVSDVIRTVGFAREHGVVLSVRGGGHNVTGNAVCDGGIALDLSAMRAIRVDPGGRTVRAEPGVTWGGYDRETQQFGLASTGGVISTTGVAGLTLGGGVGWLVRKHGLACDNLLSVDVVTADGQLLTASATEQPELFWGMRGAGANLGVVTSLEFRVHPLGPVFGGMVLHPLDRAREVIDLYRSFAPSAPDELTTYCGLLTSPDGQPVVAIVACWSGEPERAEAVLAPVRGFGRPVADLFGPLAYTQMQSLMDDAFPAGIRYYWKSDFLEQLGDDAVDVLIEAAATRTSPLSAVLLEHYGGAASRVPADATAFPHRAPQHNVVISAGWSDPSEDDVHVAWARRAWDALRPHSSGRVYVNALGVEGEDRVREAFGANYDRVAALKATYDPTNLFRLNQNVAPRAR